MTVGWVAVENAIHAWVVSGSGLDASKIIWGEQAGPRPAKPYIALTIPSVTLRGRDWLDVLDNPLVIADDLIESVDTGADTMTLKLHGLLSGDGPVRFTTTGTLPGGLALATDYWVIRVDEDTIQLAASFVDSVNTPVAIDLTSAGSGTHTLVDTSETVRQGTEIIHRARGPRELTLNLQCFAASAHSATAARAILDDVQSAITLPTPNDALVAAGVGVARFDPITSISGIVGSSTWEPRALLTAHLFVAAESSENTTYIETAEDPVGTIT